MKTSNSKQKRAWVRTIAKDKFGHYWVSTTNNLTVYNRDFRQVKFFLAKQHVSYYGHIETFFFSPDYKFGYWWNSREEIQVYCVRTQRHCYTLEKLVKGKSPSATLT